MAYFVKHVLASQNYIGIPKLGIEKNPNIRPPRKMPKKSYIFF